MNGHTDCRLHRRTGANESAVIVGSDQCSTEDHYEDHNYEMESIFSDRWRLYEDIKAAGQSWVKT